MSIIERTRPKGFNKKVWEAMYVGAVRRKAWAKDIVKNNSKWCQDASEMRLEMLGEYLHKKEWNIAESAYKYLEMRAHGQTYMGALDPCARRQWEGITGKRIGPKTQWRYDHTTQTTAAVKRKGKWKSWLNESREINVA